MKPRVCARPAAELPVPEPTNTLMPPTRSPVPPTAAPKPASCEEIDGICLQLTFDGEGCSYLGPTDIKTGSVTLIFLNESDVRAATNMIRLLEDKTLEDVIEYNGEEPSTKHAPRWSVDVRGVYWGINPAESHIWEGVLEPGIHAMVCARLQPPRRMARRRVDGGRVTGGRS